MTKCEQAQHREQVQQHDKTLHDEVPKAFFLVFLFVPKTVRRKEGVIRPLVRVGDCKTAAYYCGIAVISNFKVQTHLQRESPIGLQAFAAQEGHNSCERDGGGARQR